jgi:aldehyde dehydrogenase (NAD+)
MAMPQTIETVRHPYANGEVKRMLINGEWVRAASGKTFESRNPATGDLLATVAEGDKEDIDRAVGAARAAFEGPWSKFKPYERQALLLKIADLVEKHYDELSLLDTLDMGAPVTRTRGTKQRVLGMLRWYAGMATSIHGETIENSLPGEFFSYTLKEPIGVVGAITPADIFISADLDWMVHGRNKNTPGRLGDRFMRHIPLNMKPGKAGHRSARCRQPTS